MKSIPICLPIIISFPFLLLSAPAQFTLFKTVAPPTIDGNLSPGEWPSELFLTSITGDENVIARDDTSPHDPATDWDGELYATWDDEWLYFAVRITVDDDNVETDIDGTASQYQSDNLKVNPGGQALAFYIWNKEGAPLQFNPSTPFTEGATAFGAVRTKGNGTLPTYEFSLAKSILDPFILGSARFSIGSEEYDAPESGTSNTCCHTFLVFGGEYTGSKQDWSSSGWDNSLYYPTFIFSDSVFTSNEKTTIIGRGDKIFISPNPATSKMKIQTRGFGRSEIRIYDLNGHLVRSWSPTEESVVWNGQDLKGRSVASGTYLVRVNVGERVMSKRIVLMR